MEDCPMCGGQGEDLGTLGNVTYMRCRQCGADFSVSGEKEEYNEDAELDEDKFAEQENGGYLDWDN
jgi:tRNA(Ile2) C34 agmatinyltransferase TiaS